MAPVPKLRVLCLHGFRTSGNVFKQQMMMAQWDKALYDLLDMVFVNAPFAASGKSEVEGFFDSPFYEWWSASPDFTEYRGFEESVAYLSDVISMHGPFDGLMGFSQGAILSSTLASMRQKKLALNNVPPFRFVVIIGGSRPRATSLQNLFLDPIMCPSLHLIGEKDFMRERGEILQASFHKPTIIRHVRGHVVPKLDELQMATFRGFLGAFKPLSPPPIRQSSLDVEPSTSTM